MFDTLSDRLTGIFAKLRGKGRLTDADIDATAREIRLALLEADVALPVVKAFIARLKERARGAEVHQALNPAQQASLADVVGQHRNGGPALAAFQMSADTGAILGPVVAGLLIDNGSYPLAFGATGVITLLAAVPWLRARETHAVPRP